MAFLKIGFKNLFRQKRRTLITLLVITFGIGCLLLAVGHSRLIYYRLREQVIHTETGHLQIFNKEYFQREENNVLQWGLENYQSIVQAFPILFQALHCSTVAQNDQQYKKLYV